MNSAVTTPTEEAIGSGMRPGVFDLSVSVVTFGTAPGELETLLGCFRGSALKLLIHVVDNSPNDSLRPVALAHGCRYLRPTWGNVGFGRGHNAALRTMLDQAPYHLVINPDVLFAGDVPAQLYKFMEQHPDVGQVMPRVLYPNGKEQRLCKLLPGPLDLLERRLCGRRWLTPVLGSWLERRRARYELHHADLASPVGVPCLSGCFMFLRASVLRRVGLFDERFFLYMEDVDLCRRVGSCAATMFHPEVVITHAYAKGSYQNPKLLRYHATSAVQYFNKWGWVFDKERTTRNLRFARATSSRPQLAAVGFSSVAHGASLLQDNPGSART